ncbi:MAG TPA: MarR family transcriptional regulator, partial [Steroidobacteraceae bacterium]|nr:MarR family transcriptional regulator [Steroidobacteraceae bacterium]
QTLEEVLGSRVNIAVLRHLDAINGSLSGNEIARRLGLRESSARQALRRLVAAGVVTRTDIGNTASYQLDRELAFQRSVLAPLFRAEGRLSDDLVRDLIRAVRRLRPAPRAVFLFGSLARGARDFRDVDLLCVVSNEHDKEPLHDAVAGGFGVIRRRYKVPVSAIIAAEAELGSARLASIIDAIRREGTLIWGVPSSELREVRKLEFSQGA